MPLNNQKNSTPPFFVLSFGLCVCVGGWEGWGEWMGGDGGGGGGLLLSCV